MAAPIDLTGQTFGRLTVIEWAGKHPRNGKALWRCRCTCGKEIVTLGTYLRSGDTRSCNCLHMEATIAKGQARAIDLTGQRFGRLVVQGRAESTPRGEIRWRCQCDCGGTSTPTGGGLRRGTSLSCGCLRDELQRARAAAIGAMRRLKACRTCGFIYEAIGPQKECSALCRSRWHAADEARRRHERDALEFARESAALAIELQRRFTDAEK
jgi:rubredoxin